MQDDDPFSDPDDGDRTIMKPVPGGRRRSGAADQPPPVSPQPVSPPSAPSAEPVTPHAPAPPLAGAGISGRNCLLDAAATLFTLTKRLRDTPHFDDVGRLHASVVQAISNFESSLSGQGVDQSTLTAARYALCTLLDETVLGTPWGSGSLWSRQSLLITFHDEAFGGEKIFQILQNATQDPARNIDLLELLYVCLSLGFKGKYGAMDRGAAQLAEVQQMLYRAIAMQRGEYERELSPRWQGVADPRPAMARFVPVWVIPIVVCGLAVLIYMGFSHYLNRASDSVFGRLNELGREIPIMAARPQMPEEIISAPAPGSVQRLYGFLEDEVQRGLIDLLDQGTTTRILIHNSGLFASGQSTVSESYRPLIDKIGQALEPELGPIVISGHTDSQPIRTLRFPSNWHLSQARADSVLALLSESVSQPGKLIAEGRAETEPLASNETAEGRNRNRRIEIDVPKQ